jgi:hypothetical protein
MSRPSEERESISRLAFLQGLGIERQNSYNTDACEFRKIGVEV